VRSRITVEPHDLLQLGLFVCEWPAPLGELPPAAALEQRLAPDAPSPFRVEEVVRISIRKLLRTGGFEPTGIDRPASEYLARAVARGQFPRINRAVDLGNVVSLQTGLPVSVLDLDRLAPPLRVGLAPERTRYVFNAAGQTISAGGLVCLFDGEGPAGSPVKDAQRSKTDAATRRTLTVVWGTRTLGGHTAAVTDWYRALAVELGARAQDV
jgi:DNA/RNA-binding domain of Phe-tRNA-synthetase-like protein